MKGFTLIETILYIAISTMLCTALLSLAFTLSTTQAKLRDNTEAEAVGLYWLRAFDTAAHAHEINSFLNAIEQQSFIKNIQVSTSSIASTSSVAFTIDDTTFNLTSYEK